MCRLHQALGMLKIMVVQVHPALYSLLLRIGRKVQRITGLLVLEARNRHMSSISTLIKDTDTITE